MGRINKDKYTVALQNIEFSELLCLLSLLRHLRLDLFLFIEDFKWPNAQEVVILFVENL